MPAISKTCIRPISRRARPTVVTVRLLLKLALRQSFHSSVALIARSSRVPSTHLGAALRDTRILLAESVQRYLFFTGGSAFPVL